MEIKVTKGGSVDTVRVNLYESGAQFVPDFFERGITGVNQLIFVVLRDGVLWLVERSNKQNQGYGEKM